MSSWVWAPSADTPPGTPGERFWIMSGGIVLNGTAPFRRGRVAPLPTGGLTFGGTFPAISDRMPQEYVYVMTGGLEFGGSFVVDGRVWVDAVVPETEWVNEVGFE